MASHISDMHMCTRTCIPHSNMRHPPSRQVVDAPATLEHALLCFLSECSAWHEADLASRMARRRVGSCMIGSHRIGWY